MTTDSPDLQDYMHNLCAFIAATAEEEGHNTPGCPLSVQPKT
mgnify:CR=1 FL=1